MPKSSEPVFAKSRIRRTTLKQVAQHVGVSIGTASVVLNGSQSGSHISDQTRSQIQEAAQRLGYRPHILARNLQGGRTRIIGLVPSTLGANFVLSPHLQQVMNGAVDILEDAHHDLLLLTRCDPNNTNAVMDLLMDGRIDGVLLVSPDHQSSVFANLVSAGFPVVAIDAGMATQDYMVSIDNYSAVRLAVDHLVALGHRRIAHISGDPGKIVAQERFSAFLARMAEHQLHVPVEYIQNGSFRAEGAKKAVRVFASLENPPTAIFCANDDMAIGAIESAHELGLRVPDNLSIVGFDNVSHANLINPKLTTVHHPISEMGNYAARLLLACIEGEPAPPKPVFPVRLVVRGSTAPSLNSLSDNK